MCFNIDSEENQKKRIKSFDRIINKMKKERGSSQVLDHEGNIMDGVSLNERSLNAKLVLDQLSLQFLKKKKSS